MKRPALGGLLIFLSLRDTPLLTSVLVDAWQDVSRVRFLVCNCCVQVLMEEVDDWRKKFEWADQTLNKINDEANDLEAKLEAAKEDKTRYFSLEYGCAVLYRFGKRILNKV